MKPKHLFLLIVLAGAQAACTVTRCDLRELKHPVLLNGNPVTGPAEKSPALFSGATYSGEAWNWFTCVPLLGLAGVNGMGGQHTNTFYDQASAALAPDPSLCITGMSFTGSSEGYLAFFIALGTRERLSAKGSITRSDTVTPGLHPVTP